MLFLVLFCLSFPPVFLFSKYVLLHPPLYNILMSLYKLVTSKPEEGWSGWPKYCFKVIPLKLFCYQTLFETSRDQHIKKCNKKWGHRGCLQVSGLLKWGIFTGCALKIE